MDGLRFWTHFFFSVAGREINPEDLHISILAEDENVGDFLNTVELDEGK